jgi:hypothetical protein
LSPSRSRWLLLPGIAAVPVVMLALVRPSLWRGLTFYLPRPALRASSALHKVRGGMPLAAAGFGLGLRAEDSHPYSMRVLRVPSLGCAEYPHS